jgi:hypothetical protein
MFDGTDLGNVSRKISTLNQAECSKSQDLII